MNSMEEHPNQQVPSFTESSLQQDTLHTGVARRDDDIVTDPEVSIHPEEKMGDGAVIKKRKLDPGSTSQPPEQTTEQPPGTEPFQLLSEKIQGVDTSIQRLVAALKTSQSVEQSSVSSEIIQGILDRQRKIVRTQKQHSVQLKELKRGQVEQIQRENRRDELFGKMWKTVTRVHFDLFGTSDIDREDDGFDYLWLGSDRDASDSSEEDSKTDASESGEEDPRGSPPQP